MSRPGSHAGVRAYCPQAAIVYDLFHVVAKYGREVIDRVRIDEANRLRDDRKTRKVVKTARWPLHTSLLEGINNKIEVIRRMPYGFRDDACFLPKARAALPGNPR